MNIILSRGFFSTVVVKRGVFDMYNFSVCVLHAKATVYNTKYITLRALRPAGGTQERGFRNQRKKHT